MCCVSVIVNGLGLALYTWLTRVGIGPKLAASICFAGGVAIGFVLNRNWTFRDRAHVRRTFPRYIVAYAIAYIVDMGGLYILVDLMRYGHLIVQTILVLLIAFGLFVAQKLWIFSGLESMNPTDGAI